VSDRYYPAPYSSVHPAPFSPATVAVLQNAALGATVGAAAATAAQLKRHDSDHHLALNEVLHAGAVTGLTTAAATLVGQSLGCSRPLTRFAAMFVTGATLMYLLNPSQKGESQ
jgi:hypothetical protein